MTDKKPCPVCGGQFRQERHDWLYACQRCGLQSSTLEPVIPADPTASPIDEATRLRGLAGARAQSNSTILRGLTKHLPASQRRVLDVGCGHGLFIKAALDQGFECEGVEPDANVVPTAIATTGARIAHGYFPDALGASDTYDAIVFNDVLEHIPDASEAVSAARRHLSPGGILVLNCPDRRGIFYRIASIVDRLGLSSPFLRMWQYGLPSPHVWYFQAADLATLAEKAGLDPVETVRFTPVTIDGLWERISYVEGQSRALNVLTALASAAIIPLAGLFPKDSSIIFARKR